MKTFDTRLRRLGRLLTLLAVGCALAGCKSADDRSMAQKWGDRQVAREVKKELAKDPKYHYRNVVPMVQDGIVQLTGFVDTPEQRQRAAELASHAKGAQEIVNAITLTPAPTGRTRSRHPATYAPAPGAAEPAQPSDSANPTPNPPPNPNP